MSNVIIPATLSLLTLVYSSSSLAQTSDAKSAERCQSRLSITFLGTPEAQGLGDVASTVDSYLKRDEFIDRFSSFLNSQFNQEPGETSVEDSAYHVAKRVLTEGKPYRDLFVGPYNVVANGDQVQVMDDPNGYGYFSSEAWKLRYAGDEPTGLRLIAAYLLISNIVGHKMKATTNAPDADISPTGRAQTGCKECHFENWFALDPLAEALSRVQRDADMNVTGFTDPTPAQLPETVLGGLTVTSEKDLIQKLVDSENFRFNACQLSFKFLYGRKENSCESGVFDKCMAAFSNSGMIQDAIRAVATDSSYCQ